jgi:hypothetical protein
LEPRHNITRGRHGRKHDGVDSAKGFREAQPLDKANLNWVKETFVNDGVLKQMNLKI